MKRTTMQCSVAQTAKPHIIRQTQDAGFQIGARKTFTVSPQRAWATLTSPAGIQLWLGDVVDFQLVPGHVYKARDGAVGEVRVVQPGGHFRMTWQPKLWQKASTIQVRVMPSGEKTVISFSSGQSGRPQRA